MMNERVLRAIIMKILTLLIPMAALAWPLAGSAHAAQTPQTGKAEQKAEQKAEPKTEQKEKADRAKEGNPARENREVLEPVAFEQARYVKRSAQLERIKALAAERTTRSSAAKPRS